MSLKPRQSDDLGPRSFVIPELPPSYYEGCDIIDLLYYVQVINVINYKL